MIQIEMHDIDQWLAGSQAEAQSLLRLAPESMFDAAPRLGGLSAIDQKLKFI